MSELPKHWKPHSRALILSAGRRITSVFSSDHPTVAVDEYRISVDVLIVPVLRACWARRWPTSYSCQGEPELTRYARFATGHAYIAFGDEADAAAFWRVAYRGDLDWVRERSVVRFPQQDIDAVLDRLA